jgi:dihydroorotase-like cyclic amidohydrolase
MFTNPNKIFRLNADPKPRLTVSVNEERIIEEKNQKTKCAWTPYDGWNVKGVISEIIQQQ